jgi:outer membrane protein assembly factor BamA
VEFSGNDKLDKDDLVKEVTTKAFTYYDANKIRRDVEKLRKLYDARREAYSLADARIPIVGDDPETAVEEILRHPLFR